MAIKNLNISKASRHAQIVSRKNLTKKGGLKGLTKTKKSTAGRNSKGRIVCFHRGSGVATRSRLIDWGFKSSGPGSNRTIRLEYDPGRSAAISLVANVNGGLSYQLASNKTRPGMYSDFFLSPDAAVESMPERYPSTRAAQREHANVVLTLPLKHIPSGNSVHNIELTPGNGPIYCRSAGSSARIFRSGKEGMVHIQLPSGEHRFVPGDCLATMGVCSVDEHKHATIGIAGRRRRKGIRPTVRGCAINPVDHPHGGGEGRSNGGRPSVSPWGRIVHWKKTRRKSKDVDVIRHRNK